MKSEKQEQILACMAEVLNQNGFRAEVMRSDSAPTLLRCEAMRQGKVAKDVVIECCFIPMQLPGEESGLLQFFVTLFQDAPDLHKNQLRRACAYCNEFCALGAFGYFEQAGQIYLKHNALLDGSLPLEKKYHAARGQHLAAARIGWPLYRRTGRSSLLGHDTGERDRSGVFSKNVTSVCGTAALRQQKKVSGAP